MIHSLGEKTPTLKNMSSYSPSPNNINNNTHLFFTPNTITSYNHPNSHHLNKKVKEEDASFHQTPYSYFSTPPFSPSLITEEAAQHGSISDHETNSVLTPSTSTMDSYQSNPSGRRIITVWYTDIKKHVQDSYNINNYMKTQPKNYDSGSVFIRVKDCTNNNQSKAQKYNINKKDQCYNNRNNEQYYLYNNDNNNNEQRYYNKNSNNTNNNDTRNNERYYTNNNNDRNKNKGHIDPDNKKAPTNENYTNPVLRNSYSHDIQKTMKVDKDFMGLVRSSIERI